MSDIRLDPETHDLALPLAGVAEQDAVRQALDIRLSFFRGEWFLDTTAGIPYFQTVFKQKLAAGLGPVDAIFKDAILGTPGVLRLLEFSSRLGADRKLEISFTVMTVFGELEVEWLDFLS